ncbi:MAG: SMP-30/gluconolactonase/LRE family protein [Gammaproteobacteria bacterium]|nr:SMP-30/gluconolactonase/LRE family protein [Gammaproteobacteria bacterium]
MNLKPSAVIVTALVLTACASLDGRGRLPDRIVFERGGLIPEGIEFDTNARVLLTGSLVDGTVYRVGADGSLEAFVVDAELVSSIGIEADEPRDRLLVANADRSVFGGDGPGVAKLGVYFLSTGEKIVMVDLAAVAGAGDDDIVFTNDVTVAGDGTAYVTDTFMNQIYRVDPNYEASVLYRFEPQTGLGLNGIVHHPDGYLIVVANGGQGLLYRVPVDAPNDASPIALSQPATGADGLVWDADGRLIVVSNSTSSATAYLSNDGWQTATLVATAEFEGQATTGAVDGNDVYVVQPHFNDAEPPVILRVDLR